MGLAVGDKAPEFTLKNQDGELVEVKFTSPTVIFFYPKDNTPGCTIEAKAFRDSYTDLQKLGASVIGVSGDSVDSHKSFCSKFDLPYTLLSDEGDKVRQQYGVPKDLFGLLPGRQTYVIKDGVVVLVFNSQLKAKQQVQEAIKSLTS